MSKAATITRTPTYGGRLVLTFSTIEAALASLKVGDSLQVHFSR